MQPKAEGQQMWGGRFDARPAEIMQDINASIGFDQRLFRQDIEGSKVHCRMLAKQGIIAQDDADKILAGLDQVLQEIEAGDFPFRKELEDIHMNVEARLTEIIGEVAGKLHTARSRNDQVATDFRLWLREGIDQISGALAELNDTLEKRAQENEDTVIPGFTHLQTAQPTTFANHVRAYVSMFGRDAERFTDCRRRVNESPLGACALAGTSFPIDRDYTAQELGFHKPIANTMDAVGSRDFALEFLSCASICAVHLSRLAEELVLWSSQQFNFIALSDSFSTGSSIMPQKRNPDAAELVRGKSGRIAGAWNTLFILQKAIPMAYNKDLQEDKEPVFDAFDTLLACIRVMTGMIADMDVRKDNMRAAADMGYATATRLADWLVQNLDVPFRQAHHITGQVVKHAEREGKALSALSLDELQAFEPRIDQSIFDVL